MYALYAAFSLYIGREDMHMKQSNFNSKVLDAGEDKVTQCCVHHYNDVITCIVLTEMCEV